MNPATNDLGPSFHEKVKQKYLVLKGQPCWGEGGAIWLLEPPRPDSTFVFTEMAKSSIHCPLHTTKSNPKTWDQQNVFASKLKNPKLFCLLVCLT